MHVLFGNFAVVYESLQYGPFLKGFLKILCFFASKYRPVQPNQEYSQDFSRLELDYWSVQNAKKPIVGSVFELETNRHDNTTHIICYY